MYKARDIESKAKLLHDIYFSPSLKINFTDIEEYKYS